MVEKIIHRLVAFICASLLFASSITPQTVYAITDERFDGNEDYYHTFCTNINLTEAEEKTCDDFYNYLGQKKIDLKQELEDIKNNLEKIKSDIKVLQVKINSVNKQIRLKEESIASTEQAIAKVEANIAVLEAQILKRENDIEERDTTIKTRLEAVQSIMRVNAFADFIMGAKNFVDLIRRVEGVNDITNYDKQQIKELQEQKALLEKDKEQLDAQKALLEEEKAALEDDKAELVNIQNTQRELLAEYNTQMMEWEAEQNQVCENIEDVQQALKDLSTLKNLKPSKGWVMPTAKASISAEAFYYPASFCSAGANKCPHLGTDFAASVGTNVYAPINAVILYMYDGCSTYGYLGNYCGKPGSAGGGNQIYMVGQVGDDTYAVKILHMKQGSLNANIKWPSPDGKAVVVQQGQKLGEVGSSGNSSGAHAHVEIFYLGKKSITDVIEEFTKEPKFDFGLGFSSAGLKTTCDKTGNKAPCRVNPGKIFNVSLGKSF